MNTHRDAIDALPPLRETLKTHGILTKKELGQHFLFDLNLTDKIVSAAGKLSETTVLEVGPGPGGLTRSILRAGVHKLVIVERDATCLPVLEELKAIAGDTLTICHEDALKTNNNMLFSDAQGKVVVIANLPYNVGTELLFKWLEQPHIFRQMVLMFQKEVAERIVATPGSKDYGRLAVMCQWLYATDMLFDIPPQAFFPPPKVISSVVRLIRRDAPLAPANRATLQRLLHAVFTQRRKMLRVSLKQLTPQPEALLHQAGIEPTLRPESLDVASFCALANALDAV